MIPQLLQLFTPLYLLSAFPLTPFAEGRPDEAAFLRLLSRLTEAKVDSLGVLGSTGSYAYLTRTQRRRIEMSYIGG